MTVSSQTCVVWENEDDYFWRAAMTIARAHLIDPSVTRWYHCVTRFVRRAFLLGERENDRRVWIDNRLHELAEIFSIP